MTRKIPPYTVSKKFFKKKVVCICRSTVINFVLRTIIYVTWRKLRRKINGGDCLRNIRFEIP